MSNIKYYLSDDSSIALGKNEDGIIFKLDANRVNEIKNVNFYYCRHGYENMYMMDSKGRVLHDYLFPHIDGFEIDHINMDTLDNRTCNIRYCTHQQNQINQGLQRNNTSGVVGVSFYAPRGKYRARIKVSGQDIHLGYYDTFDDAVKARNVAMKCLFGGFGRYNEVDFIPEWIANKVIDKCTLYADIAVSSAFFDFWGLDDE
ncbi:MAG: HNH endonuclease [Tissierellia bacterium]|nr:HNH endonuclease [Tissierellia bacterium]